MAEPNELNLERAPRHPLLVQAYADERARMREREHERFKTDVTAVVAAFLLDGVDFDLELERIVEGLG